MRGCDARLLLVGLSIVVAGCYGAYQIKPDEPQSLSGLTPNVEDKDAGQANVISQVGIQLSLAFGVALVGMTATSVSADIFTRRNEKGVLEATDRASAGEGFKLAYKSKGIVMHSASFRPSSANARPSPTASVGRSLRYCGSPTGASSESESRPPEQKIDTSTRSSPAACAAAMPASSAFGLSAELRKTLERPGR